MAFEGFERDCETLKFRRPAASTARAARPATAWADAGPGHTGGSCGSRGDRGPPDFHADALGEPLLAARPQPPERAGAHQLPHRPRLRHGKPLRPRPGKDGTSLQPDRRGDDGDGAWTRPGRTSGDDALPCQGALPEGRLRPEPDSLETVPEPPPGAEACPGIRPRPSIMPKSAIQGGAEFNTHRNPPKKVAAAADGDRSDVRADRAAHKKRCSANASAWSSLENHIV